MWRLLKCFRETDHPKLSPYCFNRIFKAITFIDIICFSLENVNIIDILKGISTRSRINVFRNSPNKHSHTNDMMMWALSLSVFLLHTSSLLSYLVYDIQIFHGGF